MKKLFVIAAIVLATAGFSACGGEKTDTTTTETTTETTVDTSMSTEPSTTVDTMAAPADTTK